MLSDGFVPFDRFVQIGTELNFQFAGKGPVVRAFTGTQA
jgi:hypothetical protein